MKKKPFWIPLTITILTSALFYLAGHLFKVQLLMWTFSLESSSEGFKFESVGSLIPILIGVAAGFISERFIKKRKTI